MIKDYIIKWIYIIQKLHEKDIKDYKQIPNDILLKLTVMIILLNIIVGVGSFIIVHEVASEYINENDTPEITQNTNTLDKTKVSVIQSTDGVTVNVDEFDKNTNKIYVKAEGLTLHTFNKKGGSRTFQLPRGTNIEIVKVNESGETTTIKKTKAYLTINGNKFV